VRYKLLGKSGLRVSELALGTMTFGQDWGFGASKEESRQMFDAFVEVGGNFIDTATNYNDGSSEKFVGEFIASNRDKYVVATKYAMNGAADGDMNFSGAQRKNMVRTLEQSLKRMKTGYVDLYWVHCWDYVTPVEEVMRGLDDLVRAGKVLYIGISDTPAWVISRANMLAELRGWTQFVGLQTRYSLLERSPERDLLPMARMLDIGVTPFQVLAEGVLTGKYTHTVKPERGRAVKSPSVNDRNLAIAEEAIRIAHEAGCTPAQVALNWVRQQPGVMIPIVGARDVKQLQDNLGCLKSRLTDAQMQRLNDVSRIERGFPQEFMGSDNIKRQIFSGRFADVDFHRGESW
jgi:aryl-alcohol dehydrogenase-like predicted oxidoreductase